jgi:TonB-linked SusC/RagA family outer membrane protein
MKKIILLSGLLICLLSGFQNVQGQSSIIQGKVVDNLTQETLVGVNIVEVDKNGRFISGTITDYNGNFVFKVSDAKNPIQISFIGYKKLNIELGGRTQFEIKLESESIAMGDVVIVASKMGNDGFVSVRDRGTAVQRIELGEMKAEMSTSVEDMLQGRMGNVDISSMSGDPGAGMNIRIRGTASLNAKNQPLIVINGIPYDASIDENFDFGSADIEKFGSLIDVSPEDIESIEVLKDAASTAVWGSRASNGVLMIKTKRGTKSKPMFEYTAKATWGFEPKPVPMLDGEDYGKLMVEAHYNLANTTNLAQRNWTNKEIEFDPTWDNFYNFSQNTNWIEEITQVAFTQQHDFSVRGGGDKSRYNMSLGYFDEGGTTIGNGLKKLNLRSSLDYDLSSKLQFKTDIMFTRYDQDNTYDFEDGYFKDNRGLRSMAYRKMPNQAIHQQDTTDIYRTDKYFTPASTIQGNAKEMYNPVAFANLGKQHRYRDNARALFSLRYLISPSVILNSTITLDIFDQRKQKFLPFEALGYSGEQYPNRASYEWSKKSSIFTINQLVYRPILGDDHDLAFMGQVDTEESNSRWFKTETYNSASPYLTNSFNDKKLNFFAPI